MTLSSPKMITWVIALVLGVIGILANLVALSLIHISEPTRPY